MVVVSAVVAGVECRDSSTGSSSVSIQNHPFLGQQGAWPAASTEIDTERASCARKHFQYTK